MYTLLYPAVLGSLIFALLSFLTERQLSPSGISIAYLVFLIFYFSSQHVENNIYKEEEYTGWKFLSDVLELGLMFVLFSLLGAIETTWNVDIEQRGMSWPFYAALAITFAAPVIARMFSHRGDPFYEHRAGWLSALSISASVVTLFGICFPGNVFLFVILCILLLIYFVFFVFITFERTVE